MQTSLPTLDNVVPAKRGHPCILDQYIKSVKLARALVSKRRHTSKIRKVNNPELCLRVICILLKSYGTRFSLFYNSETRDSRKSASFPFSSFLQAKINRSGFILAKCFDASNPTDVCPNDDDGFTRQVDGNDWGINPALVSNKLFVRFTSHGEGKR